MCEGSLKCVKGTLENIILKVGMGSGKAESHCFRCLADICMSLGSV